MRTEPPRPCPVHPWPGPLPETGCGVCVLALNTAGLARPEARALARRAIIALLADWLSVPHEQIKLPATPGQAQRIDLGQHPAIDLPGCSISHEAGLSLAAINLHGPIGVDLMRPRDIPDWAALARDYLGPATARALAACAPAQRANALARAWTAREASLKCLGLALAEWTPTRPCRVLPLALPEGWLGALALPATA